MNLSWIIGDCKYAISVTWINMNQPKPVISQQMCQYGIDATHKHKSKWYPSVWAFASRLDLSLPPTDLEGPADKDTWNAREIFDESI